MNHASSLLLLGIRWAASQSLDTCVTTQDLSRSMICGRKVPKRPDVTVDVTLSFNTSGSPKLKRSGKESWDHEQCSNIHQRTCIPRFIVISWFIQCSTLIVDWWSVWGCRKLSPGPTDTEHNKLEPFKRMNSESLNVTVGNGEHREWRVVDVQVDFDTI